MSTETAAAIGRDAPAKINLTLAMTGRRPDGYHELASVFARIGLADRLEVAIAGAATGDGAIRGDALEIIGDDACPVVGNLVLRAAALLRETAGRPLPRLQFRLFKRIPMGAGLAGGSTDAAAALDLAASAWQLALDPGVLARLALRLGADVPFFLGPDPIALVEGVGEVVTPLPPVIDGAGVLLIIPPVPMSTAAVFAAHDRILAAERASGVPRSAATVPSPALARTAELAERLRAGLGGARLASWAADLRDANDLWAAATSVAPRLAALRDALESRLGQAVLLTGSGCTLLSLYASEGAALAAAERLAASAPATAIAGCRITATHTLGQPHTETPA